MADTVPAPDDFAPTGGRFRKRPLVIEAYRFDLHAPGLGLPPEFLDEVCAVGGSRPCVRNGWAHAGWDVNAHIDTLEGPRRINDGDWIIRGTQGEFYPVSPAVFAEVYEPAES